MVLTVKMLLEKLHTYKDPSGKIMRMTRCGELFVLTRGIYETNRATPGYLLAPVIYGPSYLSFDYALSRYGLIPEAVYAFTSATYDKKKSKEYENVFGRFTYRDVPKDAYPFGINLITENEYSYQIATPEKALCDKLYSVSPVTSVRELRGLLFDDLRIDETEFDKLDFDTLSELCDVYHTNNLKYLKKLIRR